jgi:hypothetical protein
MKMNGKTHVQVNKLHMVFSKEGKIHEKYELLLKHLATRRNFHHLDSNKNLEL